MYKYSAGFVGAGHMGGILAGIAVRTAGCGRTAVVCSTEDSTEAAAQRLGCAADTADNILADSEFIFLGFRPADLGGFAQANRSAIAGAQGTFVSMLSGVSIAALEEKLGADKKIIRIMPNTPCEIGKGLIGYVCSNNAGDVQAQGLKALISPAGLIEGIPEREMDMFSVVAACAPAYTYFFADALAKGGEQCSMDRDRAVSFIAQMLAGSAGMLLKGDKTPAALRDEVCTPGGTTIEGVNRLREGGFEALVAEAVKASYNKTVGR